MACRVAEVRRAFQYAVDNELCSCNIENVQL